MTQTFKVTYTKANGNEGTILVKATNEAEAIRNAKNNCYTGSDFRNPVVTDEKYVTPKEQGFQGTNRQN